MILHARVLGSKCGQLGVIVETTIDILCGLVYVLILCILYNILSQILCHIHGSVIMHASSFLIAKYYNRCASYDYDLIRSKLVQNAKFVPSSIQVF